jgi:L-iditol 2-dehydrogenase
MKALVLEETRKLVWKEIDRPELKKGEVIIEVKYVGVCGSDVHYYEHGRIGDFVVEKPLILGHEFSGIVVEKADDVSNLEIGDLVTCEPGYGCGQCDFCKSGRYNLCDDMRFMATPPIDGCLTDYVSYPANMVYKLPDGMNLRDGALIEPLAIGVYATERAEIELADSVLVFGAGCIGLVTMLSLKAKGASRVIVIDTLNNRLDKAKELGADLVINPIEENAIEIVNEITNNKGVDVVIDCAGAKPTILSTVDYVKKGGKIVFVGMSQDDQIPFRLNRAISKEIDIKTIFRYHSMFERTINAVYSGMIDISKIISDVFAYEDSIEAFETVSKKKQEVIKAVIER